MSGFWRGATERANRKIPFFVSARERFCHLAIPSRPAGGRRTTEPGSFERGFDFVASGTVEKRGLSTALIRLTKKLAISIVCCLQRWRFLVLMHAERCRT